MKARWPSWPALKPKVSAARAMYHRLCPGEIVVLVRHALIRWQYRLFYRSIPRAYCGPPIRMILADASCPDLYRDLSPFCRAGRAVQNSPYAAVEISSSDSTTVAELIDLTYGARPAIHGVCQPRYRAPPLRLSRLFIFRPIWWSNIAMPLRA